MGVTQAITWKNQICTTGSCDTSFFIGKLNKYHIGTYGLKWNSESFMFGVRYGWPELQKARISKTRLAESSKFWLSATRVTHNEPQTMNDSLSSPAFNQAPYFVDTRSLVASFRAAILTSFARGTVTSLHKHKLASCGQWRAISLAKDRYQKRQQPTGRRVTLEYR